MGIDSGPHPLAVAWSAAIYHRPELIPVYGAEIVMAARFIPLKVRVGYCQFEMVPLRHRDVDKPLAQFIVTLTLDFPGHGLAAVGRLAVMRSKHH